MREIKFRAWDKISKKMFTPVSLLSSFDSKGCSYAVETKSHIYMQFTGLFDKNGKEIYEGDVVKINDARIGEVYYENMYARFGFTLNRFMKGLVDLPAGDFSFYDFSQWDIEVIGNVYENLELLNK